MTTPTPINLSLLDNSHAFLRESVAKAVAAENDSRQWQFATVHVVQSLELSLKALLYKIHPVLVFENVDKQKNTVSHRQALERLTSPAIGNLKITKGEQDKISEAIDLRNVFTHYEFELKPEFATAKFCEMFAFVVHFQARHFQLDVEQIIDVNDYHTVLGIEKAMEKLAEGARKRIEEEGLLAWVWTCPSCVQETYVHKPGVNKCYTCRDTEIVKDCPRCKRPVFEAAMINFSDEFEWESGEGEMELLNTFGYDYDEVCWTCYGATVFDISERRCEIKHKSIGLVERAKAGAVFAGTVTRVCEACGESFERTSAEEKRCPNCRSK